MKNSKPTEINEKLTKINPFYIPSANLHLLPYEHTERFVNAGKNPLEDERKLLETGNEKVDWLLACKRLPSIKADTLVELRQAAAQMAENDNSIEAIINKEIGEVAKVKLFLNYLDEEILEYEKQIEELGGEIYGK